MEPWSIRGGFSAEVILSKLDPAASTNELYISSFQRRAFAKEPELYKPSAAEKNYSTPKDACTRNNFSEMEE